MGSGSIEDADLTISAFRQNSVGVRPSPYSQPMTNKKRRRSIKLLLCPECGQVGTLRTILYGMPDPEVFDFEKYAVGGCCMNGDGSDPDIRCKECGWEGLRDTDLNPQGSQNDNPAKG